MLKALALVLAHHLPVPRSCTHVPGHGGAKAAVRAVWRRLPENRFVLRTDVRSYYASIDHHRLIDQLGEVIQDRAVLSLLWLYLRRTVEHGGLFHDHRQGISRGCPLSPLIGAFFLRRLDEQMTRLGLFYVRFMDDVLVLAPTRWKLRKAVAAVNRGLGALGLAKHPDKTFVGRTAKGFDFLGYHFGRERLTVAKATLERFVERATRLYEQGPGEPEGSHRLGTYVRRWAQWVRAGLGAPVRSAHGTANEPSPTSGYRSLARLRLQDHSCSLGVPDRHLLLRDRTRSTKTRAVAVESPRTRPVPTRGNNQ